MVTSSFKNKMGIIIGIHANSQDNEPNILLQYKMKVVKIQTTSKNTQQYYIPKRLISYLSSKSFFSAKSLLISYEAGKAKQIEKFSLSSQLVNQVFLQYKITNCPNNCTTLQDICAIFALFFVQLDNISFYSNT